MNVVDIVGGIIVDDVWRRVVAVDRIEVRYELSC